MSDSEIKPQALSVQPDNIPVELRVRRQWCMWGYEFRPDRSPSKPWTKPPLQISGDYAKSNDPSTWTSLDEAVRHLSQFDGRALCSLQTTPTSGLI
jgi:primase-polymerase (primpol)-like protein